MPKPPQITVVLPAADAHPAVWSYTTTYPGRGWAAPTFNDAAWTQGPGGFGSAGTPGATIGTTWRSPDIWLRRTVDLPAQDWAGLQVWLHHDDDAEVYLNGVTARHRQRFHLRLRLL